MNKLASLVVDLLCAITFEPETGTDPEDSANLQRVGWQTLIHDLTPEEAAAVNQCVEQRVKEMSSWPQPLTSHLEAQLATLQGFLRAELS